MVQANALISIISPVYKKKAFLHKLVQSVKCQSYGNWELIFIEDHGEDGSLELLKGFALTDRRIKVAANAINRGVDYSRFMGINISRGDYVIFVDADDWLAPEALRKLYLKAVATNAEIVYGAFSKVIDRFGLIRKPRFNSYLKSNMVGEIIQPQLFDDFYISYFGVNKLLISMCGKLYKRSVLDLAPIRPTGYKMGEDLIFNMTLHPYLNRVAFISDVVYYYRWGGMTDKFNPTFLSDIKNQYLLKKENIQQYGYEKALPYIKFELANCFYSHFLNQLLLEKLSLNDLKLNIKAELEDCIYKELEDVRQQKAVAIFNRQIEMISLDVWNAYKKTKYKYLLKKIINSLLN